MQFDEISVNHIQITLLVTPHYVERPVFCTILAESRVLPYKTRAVTSATKS